MDGSLNFQANHCANVPSPKINEIANKGRIAIITEYLINNDATT